MDETRPDEDLLLQSTDLVLVSAHYATGQPEEERLRFAYADGVIYLLAPSGADWYHNLEADRGVVARIKRRGFRGRAHVFDVKQHTKIVAELLAKFRKKYDAAALKTMEQETLRPVFIDVQF